MVPYTTKIDQNISKKSSTHHTSRLTRKENAKMLDHEHKQSTKLKGKTSTLI
jgi:hypothetical protein